MSLSHKNTLETLRRAARVLSRHHTFWLLAIRSCEFAYNVFGSITQHIATLKFFGTPGSVAECRLLVMSGVPGRIQAHVLKRNLKAAGVSLRDVCCVVGGNHAAVLAAEGIRSISISETWINTSLDIQIHTDWHNFRSRRYGARGESQEIQSLVEIQYSVLELYLRRVSAAVQMAKKQAKIVIISVDRFRNSVEHLSAYLENSQAAHRLIVRLNHLEVVPLRAPEFTSRLKLPPIHHVEPSDCSRLSDEADRLSMSAKGERPVVFVSDAAVDSPHGRTALRILSALRSRGTPVIALIGSQKLGAVLRRAGIAPESAHLPLARPRHSSLSAEIDAFLLHVSELIQETQDAAERAAAYWLTEDARRIDIELAWETKKLFKLLFQHSQARSILVHPHWSSTAHIAALAATELELPVISAPIMTVEANNASIVGWDRINIIPAYGSQCVDAFREMGFPVESLPIIGNLTFDDALKTEPATARKRFLGHIGADIDDHKKIVLVATSRIDPNEDLWIAAVAELCRSRGDTIVVARLHPAFCHLENELKAKLGGQGVLVSTKGAIDDAIACARLVITDFSTVGAQAVIMRRQLMTVNLTATPFPANDYAALGVAATATKLAEVAPMVNDILNGKQVVGSEAILKFEEKYNGPNDGHAMERLCKIIEEPLCKERRETLSAPALMYHHFHGDKHFPVQGSISADQFDAELTRISEKWNLMSAEDWLERALQGRLRGEDTCITFDDSLKCQYDVARPVLQQRGLTAFWFVYTAILEGEPIRLEIYRKFRNSCFKDIDDFYAKYFSFAEKSQFGDLINSNTTTFDPSTYLSQWNFYTDNDRKYRFIRDEVLGPDRYMNLMDGFIVHCNHSIASLAHGLWLDHGELAQLVREGHIIGLHSHSHPTRLALLPVSTQRQEYETNSKVLAEICGCRPCVAAHPNNSYSEDTLSILRDLGVKVAFSSEPNPAMKTMLTMPRIDRAELS